jgi:predicted phosphoribosyltransferase
VDDGIATGATIKAAILTLKSGNPAAIIIAVPVAPPEVCDQLEKLVDRVICLHKTLRIGDQFLFGTKTFTKPAMKEVQTLLATVDSSLIQV